MVAVERSSFAKKVMLEQEKRFCDAVAADVPPPDPTKPAVVSLKMMQQRAREAAREGLNFYQEFLQEGFSAILEELKVYDRVQEKAVSSWFFRHFEEISVCMQAQDPLQGCATLRERLRFPDQLLQQLYLSTFRLMQAKSSHLMGAAMVCLLFDPLVAEFWKLYGYGLQQKEEWDASIQAYKVMGILLPDDPYPHLAKARALLSMKMTHEALFEIALSKKKLEAHPSESLGAYLQQLELIAQKQA